MCCPPSGWQGRPSAFGPTRDEALAAARQQIAERKKQEAAQTSQSASEFSKRASGSDQDSESAHEVSEKTGQASVNADRSPRQSFRTRCRQKLRKCLP